MEGNDNDNEHAYDPLSPYDPIPSQPQQFVVGETVYQRRARNQQSYQTPGITFSTNLSSSRRRDKDKKSHRSAERRFNDAEVIRGVQSRSKNYHYVDGKKVAGSIVSTIAQSRNRPQSNTKVTQPSLGSERRNRRASSAVIHDDINTTTDASQRQNQFYHFGQPHISTDLQGYRDDTAYSQDPSAYDPAAFGNTDENEGINLQGLQWANRALFTNTAPDLDRVTTGMENLGLTSSHGHERGLTQSWLMGDTGTQNDASHFHGPYHPLPLAYGPAPAPDDEICEITFSYTSTRMHGSKRVRTFSGITGSTGREIEKAVEQWSV